MKILIFCNLISLSCETIERHKPKALKQFFLSSKYVLPIILLLMIFNAFQERPLLSLNYIGFQKKSHLEEKKKSFEILMTWVKLVKENFKCSRRFLVIVRPQFYILLISSAQNLREKKSTSWNFRVRKLIFRANRKFM